VSLPAVAPDAIVLAVWSNAPVYVATELLENHGEAGPFEGEDRDLPDPGHSPVAADDAFRQFVDSLHSLDDLTEGPVL
jgi:bifunctional DNase/RNase